MPHLLFWTEIKTRFQTSNFHLRAFSGIEEICGDHLVFVNRKLGLSLQLTLLNKSEFRFLKWLGRIPFKVRAITCKNYLLKIYSQHANFYLKHLIVIQFSAMKSPSILEKFNVKLRKNAKSECYCVFYNKREMSFLTEIWITSTSIFSRGVSLRA